MKIVLFNGPPRSGKDTFGKTLYGMLNMKKVKTDLLWFAQPLKNATHAAYGLSGISWNHFEDSKEDRKPEFFGLTPRQAYIKMSEEMVKPAGGKDFWGRVNLRRVRHLELKGTEVCIFADSGFKDEAIPLIEKFGAENVMLVRINRDGCDFSNDSRGHWHDARLITWELKNDIPMEQIHSLLNTTVIPWINEEYQGHATTNPSSVSRGSPKLRLVKSHDTVSDSER